MKHIFGAVFAAVLAMTFAAPAFGHATITPEAVAPHTQANFTLRLREEVEGARTTRVEMTVPAGFSMAATASDPGWRLHSAGRAHLWTGRGEPVFHFTGTTGDAGDRAFRVRQTYSDGSVVEWAAIVRVSDGGGLSTLAIVVFAIGGVAILAGVVVLLARHRPLA